MKAHLRMGISTTHIPREAEKRRVYPTRSVKRAVKPVKHEITNYGLFGTTIVPGKSGAAREFSRPGSRASRIEV
jgi:hypothetical protein